MICHKIGCSPMVIIGFGFKWLSSLIRVPSPPAKITTFITHFSQYFLPILFRILNKAYCVTFYTVMPAANFCHVLSARPQQLGFAPGTSRMLLIIRCTRPRPSSHRSWHTQYPA